MADPSKLHIGLFPRLAIGHLTPFLELAKLLASKGHKISFISTPKNIDRLPQLPPNLTPLINFVKLPLPHVDGLPHDAEATIDLPLHKVQCLKKAYDALQPHLTIFLQNSDLDWLLYDFAAYWLPHIASELSISHGFFYITLASSLTLFHPPGVTDDRTKPEDFTVPPKWITFPTKVAFRLFEILNIFESVVGDVSGTTDLHRFEEVIRGCEVIAVRSCSEFEPQWLNLVENLHGKRCLPVGMLPPLDYDHLAEDSETWKTFKQWLDKQKTGSVVYVAFGTEAKPSQTELNEIAYGLELSGLPFFWVLRKRRGLADTEVLELPDGFEERTKERGVICTSWAPQLKILGHDSVGGFLTHSGWSSVIEAGHQGRPLILLTSLSDTGLIARVLEDKKMGYSVPRNELDGSFTRNSVAESLKLVVVEEEGKVYREKAIEMKSLFGDGDKQNMYTNSFLDYLKSHKVKKGVS